MHAVFLCDEGVSSVSVLCCLYALTTDETKFELYDLTAFVTVQAAASSVLLEPLWEIIWAQLGTVQQLRVGGTTVFGLWQVHVVVSLPRQQWWLHEPTGSGFFAGGSQNVMFKRFCFCLLSWHRFCEHSSLLWAEVLSWAFNYAAHNLPYCSFSERQFVFLIWKTLCFLQCAWRVCTATLPRPNLYLLFHRYWCVLLCYVCSHTQIELAALHVLNVCAEGT